MTTHRWLSLCAAMLSLLLASTASSSDDTSVHHLKDLANGESRTYGSGDHKVTAKRDGDMVTLTIDEGEGKTRTLKIDLSGGDASVMTLDGSEDADAGAHKVIVVKKKKAGKADGGATIADGDGTEDIEVSANVVGGPGVMVLKGSDGGAFDFDLDIPSIEPIFESKDGGKVVKIMASDRTLLRCPKGDTTMRVDKDDHGTYYCPKHNVALEQTKGRAIMRSVIVTDDDKGSDDKGKDGAPADKDKAPSSSRYESRTITGEARYTGKPVSLDF